MIPYLKILLILTGFAFYHTVTISPNTQAAIRKKTGLSFGAYAGSRAIASLALLVLSVYILLQEAASTTVLFPPVLGVPAILPAMFAFWLAGMALMQVARSGRLPQFFGFREYPKLFIFTGAYTICRHPMYTGWLVAGWGLVISQPFALTVFYNILITCFVVYLSILEERRMVELFGEKYRAYQSQVPFLLPYGFLKSQIRSEGAPRF
jgi:protein-S-isoprenylcysteine O-methyltransferase Ste14